MGRASHQQADVAIVGAGVAGLAAAGALVGRGASVCIVEARERTGGRLHTISAAGWPCPIEAGGEFVHGEPPALWKALAEAGQEPKDADGRHYLCEAGRIEPAGALWERAQGLIARAGSRDQSMAAALGALRARDQQALQLARSFIEGFHAAELGRASARAIHQQELAAEAIKGDRLYRLPRGYSALAAHLSRGLAPSLQLGTVVRQIRWSRRGVELLAWRTRQGAPLLVRARQALITLPLGVLQARAGARGAVRFDPPLPGWKREAISALQMGPVVKVALQFRARPWGKLRGPGFLHAPGAAFPTFWTPLPFRAPVLVGWAAGPAARALSGSSRGRLVATALRSLAGALGRSASDLSDLLVSAMAFDWQRDPFARGAYSWVPVGAKNAQAGLARPVGDTLFFAGEASHAGGASATVHGAFETGERAARELEMATSRTAFASIL